MRLELEHNDIVKALALYLRTKGFEVAPELSNFVFKNESTDPAQIELLVTVKNADAVPVAAAPAPPAPPPAPPRAAPPAARGAAAPQRAAPQRPAPPKKNDLYRPVAPPHEHVPEPKHRVLDKQAASSPALRSPGRHPDMPHAAQIVADYGPTAKEGELLDDALDAPEGAAHEGLLVAPSTADALTDEERAIVDDILARSAERASVGPNFDMTGAGEVMPEGLVDE